MVYQATIEKEKIKTLPQAKFNGKIILMNEDEISAETVAHLNSQRLIGFDTESKPSFVKGEKNRVALIQVACEKDCYLFRLNTKELSPVLNDLFNNPNIIKVGLSSKDDFLHLRAASKNFKPQNVVELQSYVTSFGIEDMSLQKIYAIVFGQRISKVQQLSNWEAEELSEAQRQYAALDAWAVRQIYLKLNGKLDLD